MKDFKSFIHDYRGAIIGGIIAIIVLCTGLLRLAISIIVICAGVFLCYYVQQNKYEVKEKLHNLINRM